MTPALPPFPPSGALPPNGALRRAKLTLRAATDGDLTFLRTLYDASRADELAGTAWPDAERARFLDSQFVLQHRHFVTVHPAGDFFVVERRGTAVGRLYLDRSAPVWRLVDIALSPSARGQGIGTVLLHWLQHAARAAGATGVELHVLRQNHRATRLYAAAGFVDAITASPTHRRMTWRIAG